MIGERECLKCSVRAGVEHYCPFCNNRIVAKRRKSRKGKRLDGMVDTYLIEDRKCSGCGSMHRLLPDCLIPFKHYEAAAIEEILESSEDNVLGDNPEAEPTLIRRIKRWWKSAESYLTGVAETIAFKFSPLIKTPAAIRELIRIAVNFTGKFFTRFDLLSV